MSKGGYRPGAGRPKGTRSGTRSRKLLEGEDEAAAVGIWRETLEKKGMTPLQIMIKAMISVYEEDGAVAAFQLAKECAPYMHARYASIEFKGEVDNKHYVISAGIRWTPLSRPRSGENK